MEPTTIVDPDAQKLKEVFDERLKQLPKVVQNAITSADLEKNLRALAEVHKLHVDQWELLENEVKLTLYGFQPTEALEKNILNEVGVDKDTAAMLNASISKIVFEPIRQELERQLEHPDAKAAEVSDMETARQQAIASQDGTVAQAPAQNAPPAAPAVAPATPPTPAPTTKVERAPISPAYTPQQASHERKDIEGDPYREQVA